MTGAIIGLCVGLFMASLQMWWVSKRYDNESKERLTAAEKLNENSTQALENAQRLLSNADAAHIKAANEHNAYVQSRIARHEQMSVGIRTTFAEEFDRLVLGAERWKVIKRIMMATPQSSPERSKLASFCAVLADTTNSNIETTFELWFPKENPLTYGPTEIYVAPGTKCTCGSPNATPTQHGAFCALHGVRRLVPPVAAPIPT